MSAKVTVKRDGIAWYAECDGTCPAPLGLLAEFWRDAMEVALGHLCLTHRTVAS